MKLKLVMKLSSSVLSFIIKYNILSNYLIVLILWTGYWLVGVIMKRCHLVGGGRTAANWGRIEAATATWVLETAMFVNSAKNFGLVLQDGGCRMCRQLCSRLLSSQN